MLNLFSKDEDIEKSAPIVGSYILKCLHGRDKISIFELVKQLRRKKLVGVRSIYYGMIFLYALDLIEFNEPYVVLKNVKNQ
ncbi:ABC-three component system middle component 6 [Citrobacter sp. Marseille-Q6884]|uniref:ABC-three component system middle component 6 n=1 Tax=Citrobacter sp. Marseille-Q6884 TaxID=2956786 RepID=UPI00391F0D3E